MRKFTLIIMVALIASTSVFAGEYQTTSAPAVDDIDREMIGLLEMSHEQALAYSAIMQKQRKVFLALPPHQWQQQLDLYEETIAMLKPVLSTKQHARFVAYLGCLIEEIQQDEFLAME